LAILSATSAPSRAQDPTEIAFWSMVRESRRAADIRAYLEAYPRGAYAEEARRRLDDIENSPRRPSSAGPIPSGPSRPMPGPSGPSHSGDTSPALTSESVIREVQERLYNLNYNVFNANGRLTAETRQAIREWQGNTQRPVTGDMTMEELTALRNAQLPATWGALAFGDRGSSAVVWKRVSRRVAVNAALEDCRKNNRGKECKVLSAPNDACGALGFYMAGGSWGAYAVVAPTLGKATAQALEQCREQGRRPDACGVRITFCADGSHQQ
jgi:peptidoglycan hydrolase-like protein with peptidoglycan-binding domain